MYVYIYIHIYIYIYICNCFNPMYLLLLLLLFLFTIFILYLFPIIYYFQLFNYLLFIYYNASSISLRTFSIIIHLVVKLIKLIVNFILHFFYYQVSTISSCLIYLFLTLDLLHLTVTRIYNIDINNLYIYN